MKTLNFFPYYEELLSSKRKTTTLRLANRHALQAGERVLLTIGWDEQSAKPLSEITIERAYEKPLQDLNTSDLAGESPDCASPEAARLVLSSVYRRLVGPSDCVCVIKFKHVP